MTQSEPVTPAHQGFMRLVEEARVEGFRFIDRLRENWEDGSNRFDAAGECLLGLSSADALYAIGGLNIEPYETLPASGRLRHLYVRPHWRRQGHGRRLVISLLDAARPHFVRIGLRTDNPEAARFYEALGFQRVASAHATHAMDLR